MGDIIDFHTHVFPDDLAERAITTLEAEADGVKAHIGGKLSDLVASMDKADIWHSVVCSIATRPKQFEPIMKFSSTIQSKRITALPSIHPSDTDAVKRIRAISEAGFKGIKMHPYYQEFYLDEERMTPIYRALSESGLFLVMHTGYDIAFPPIRYADPERIIKISNRFPNLKLVTTHLGAWKLWDEVRDILIGKPIYMEISFALEYLSKDEARDMIMRHPEGYILFGTDSPWTPQDGTLKKLLSLGLPSEMESGILSGNARRLLGMS